IINLCTSNTISLEEIALTIAKKFNKINLLELKKLNTEEPKIIVGDNSRLVNEIGFKNFITVGEWVNKYLN
ncbi:NAD-dependent epimerase, partial [Brachyspira hyodysenteriae]